MVSENKNFRKQKLESVPRAPGIEPSEEAARKPPHVIQFTGQEYSDDFRMFQGIPGIERASNGRLWAAWYGGDVGEHEGNYLMLATSADNGDTWSEISLIVDPDGEGPAEGFDPQIWKTKASKVGDLPRNPGNMRAFDPMLWLDTSGKLWLFWSQRTGRSTAATWAMNTENPEDSMTRWSQPAHILDGIALNKPTILSSGEWLLPVAYWMAGLPRSKPEDASSAVFISRDEGGTWDYLGAAMIPKLEDRNADEHMIVERRDGSLWMLVRTMYGMGESVSLDRGKTWSDVQKSSIEHPVSRFFIRRLSSGNLLFVKHGPIHEQTSRKLLTAYLSADDGKTWQGGLVLAERGISYPDGVEAPDGTLYVIYDYNRYSDKKILMARFTEEDILAGKLVSDGSALGLVINQAFGINLARYFKFSPNSDGEDLLEGHAARIQSTNGEIAILKKDARLFLDCENTVFHLPSELEGRSFLRGNMEGYRVCIAKAGRILVLTPSPERNESESLTASLIKQGFKKVNIPECVLFLEQGEEHFSKRGKNNVCSTYQKTLEAGEEIQLGKWGIIIL